MPVKYAGYLKLFYFINKMVPEIGKDNYKSSLIRSN